MDFKLTKPCPECPFTDGPKSVRGLHPRRVMELATNARSHHGAMFACHKTVDYSGVDGDGFTEGDDRNAHHCAGALIFSLRGGYATQMMRIAERLGAFSPAAILADQDAVRSVYENARAMQAGHRKGSVRP